MREHRKMTLKRIGIGILCMVFVLSMLAPLVAFAEEKTESGSQVSKRELAYIQISVGDGQETPVFKAGQKVSEFRINVKNNGNVDAHNVRIEPDIKNASDWPFELDKLNYEKELSTIKSGGQTAAVWGSEEKPLIVRGDVTGKSYKLEFKISYDDGEKSYETDKYVFVKTTAKRKAIGKSGWKCKRRRDKQRKYRKRKRRIGKCAGNAGRFGRGVRRSIYQRSGHGRRLGRRRGCVKRICSAGDCNRI